MYSSIYCKAKNEYFSVDQVKNRFAQFGRLKNILDCHIGQKFEKTFLFANTSYVAVKMLK